MVLLSDSLDLRNSIILLKLARFVSSKEQKSIRRDLIGIIPKEVDIRPDEWAKQRRILLKIPSKKINDSESFLKQIAQLPGILTIIIFSNQNFNFPTENLSELVNYTLSVIEANDRPINIKFQAIGSIPFHKKAFLDRLKKKKPQNDELTKKPLELYLECKEENSQVLGRLGLIYQDQKKEPNMAIKNETITNLNITNRGLSVILFSPYTTIEIADFCRINLNFDFLEVKFSNENEKVQEIIEETSKTLFKGIDKVKFEVIPSLNNFIRNNSDKYLFLGFSLHSTKDEVDLKRALNNSQKIPCIIIGNEVRGLEYSTQKMIDMFKIGTGSSEPLRGSHVLSFVLGMLT